ncbi:MAG: hypothetical protein FWF82_06815 [Oscillospiraceae bacterium]|nr:hypothetical protein [Oscillospiraceae bacterium]
MAKYCNLCLTQLKEGDVACPLCGHVPPSQTAPMQVEPMQAAPAPKRAATAPKPAATAPRRAAQSSSMLDEPSPLPKSAPKPAAKPLPPAMLPTAKVPEAPQTPKVSFATPSKSSQPGFEIGPVNVNAIYEDHATISVAGKSFRLAGIFKIAAFVLLGIFLVLPMYTKMYHSSPISFSGLYVITGKQITSGIVTNFNPVAILLLLIPVALFLLFQFKENLEFVQDKLFIFSAGICGLGFLILIVIAIMASGQNVFPMAGGEVVLSGATLSAGFVLSMITYLLFGGISALCILSQKK